ncbi:hypothetical protein ABH899_000540 [Paenibacillus sp. RC84]
MTAVPFPYIPTRRMRMDRIAVDYLANLYDGIPAGSGYENRRVGFHAYFLLLLGVKVF